MNKETKDFLEREMKQYWNNKDILNMLKSSKLNSMSTRSLLIVEQRMKYIENAYNQLRPFEKAVYNLIFKDCYDWTYCEANKNISKSTYYNIYNKSIELLAKEWGYL